MKLTKTEVVHREYDIELPIPKCITLFNLIYWRFEEKGKKVWVLRMTLRQGEFQIDYREAMSSDLEEFQKIGSDGISEISIEEFNSAYFSAISETGIVA